MIFLDKKGKRLWHDLVHITHLKFHFFDRELYYDKNATGIRRWADKKNWSNIASGEHLPKYTGESDYFILKDIGWVE